VDAPPTPRQRLFHRTRPENQMTIELPESLVRLVTECPVDQVRGSSINAAMERVLDGDLQFAASIYASNAQYHGADGNWWRVWREIQRARGKTLVEALNDLHRDRLRWFAKWSFAVADKGEGRVAYRHYLDDPGGIGPFSDETATYLDYLLDEGEHQEVVETVDELAAKYDDVPHEQTKAVRALCSLGDVQAALKRLLSVRDRHHDSGDLWALGALLYKQQGENQLAETFFAECAKLDIWDTELKQEVLRAFQLTEDDWAEVRSPWETPEWNYEQQVRNWLGDPGARLKPVDAKSPHWFGDRTFEMPNCRGCGHRIREWFVLDIREIPNLSQLLPSWTLFPLLGCMDCSVWMGRHDYEIDLDRLVVRLVNLTISVTQFGEAFDTMPELSKQPARLATIEPMRVADCHSCDDLLDLFDSGTQVAGTPNWAQDPERVYCRSCREEMEFVAAMASVDEFEPYVPINNESGYQYHFACDRCKTISVIAQWT
jgi:hypothetical protein